MSGRIISSSSFFFFYTQRQTRLTLHIHPDGLDGRHAHAVLSLAVVAAALRARDALDAQCLIEHRCFLELVRRAARGLGPTHLGQPGRAESDRTEGEGEGEGEGGSPPTPILFHECT